MAHRTPLQMSVQPKHCCTCLPAAQRQAQLRAAATERERPQLQLQLNARGSPQEPAGSPSKPSLSAIKTGSGGWQAAKRKLQQQGVPGSGAGQRNVQGGPALLQVHCWACAFLVGGLCWVPDMHCLHFWARLTGVPALGVRHIATCGSLCPERRSVKRKTSWQRLLA